MWVAILEKRFTFYRQSKGTYASISGGWMSEAFTAMGRSASSIWTGSVGSSEKLDRADSIAARRRQGVTFAVKRAQRRAAGWQSCVHGRCGRG